MSKPILGFKTKKACGEAIRMEVDQYRETRMEFFAPLTKELLSKHHHGCVAAGVTPIKFKWTIHPILGTEHCFTAFFDDPRFPNLKWKRLSFNKALDRFILNDSTLNGEIKSQLRILINPIIENYRNKHLTCERCGSQSHEVLRVDHVDPEFDDMANSTIGMLTPRERSEILNDYDWLKEEPFKIPDKCIQYILKAHETAKLMAVCYSCHVQNHRDRKKRKCT